MTPDLCSNRKASQHLPAGPLNLYIVGFRESLAEHGYKSVALYQKTRLLVEFDEWLAHHRIGIENLDEKQAQKFLHYRRIQYHDRRSGDPTTLRVFFSYLREASVIPYPVVKPDDSAIDRARANFAQYLAEERGLSPATLDNYLREIREFLSQRFGRGAVSWRALRPQDITGFILRRARAGSPSRAQLATSALRSFLRFLYQRGDIWTDLAASVLTVASWRLSALPKYLLPHQVERLLQSCDGSSAVGLRDYTVLLLLARLGLRGGEVAHLTLDDIDWEAGEILVGGKGGHWDRLPIPRDVGDALVTYLRDMRPRCASRRVFIRLRAPHEGFVTSAAVCDIVRRALKRARISPGFRGAHLLRHSLATRMLRGGATLAEIGEVLRHRLPRTTEIYAKVDLAALRTLAQPWPGGEV